MNYMGIDVGTSGCKAVVFDQLGKESSSAYREYDAVFTDDGGAELNSEEVMAKCFDVIREAASGAEPASVKGIGIASQGEAFTALGKDGKALCNGMISSDTRSAGYIESWTAEFGVEKLYQITGHTAHPMHTLFKFLWLKDHHPGVWERADKFLCFEDLLQHRLGVDPAMGWSLAARTMMFDVRKHVWDPAILAALGLTQEHLARALPSGSVAGRVDPDVAAKLGLAGDVFVVSAGHDQTCAALGSGVTEPGVAMYATGTVECICPAFSEPTFTDELRQSNLCTYDHTVQGMYVTVAFSLTGGNILKWFRDEFGAQEVAEAEKTGRNAYELLLEQVEDAPSSLTVLPYFTPSGTPYFDIETPGAILGLRLSTRRGDVIKALLEGVALEMRLNLDILEQARCGIHELRAIGGGARSAVWTQIKADVIGKPIKTCDVAEAGCLGAAMLACAAHTGESLHELAGKWVKIVSTVQPDPSRAEAYARRFELYRRLYPAAKSLFLDKA